MPISRKIREQLNPDRISYMGAGYGVPYAHFNVIPNYHANDITREHFAVLKEGKIDFTDERMVLLLEVE